jgi:hypothetical protein
MLLVYCEDVYNKENTKSIALVEMQSVKGTSYVKRFYAIFNAFILQNNKPKQIK